MQRKKKLIILIIILGAGAIGSVFFASQLGSEKPTVAIFNLLSHPILDASVKGIKDGLSEAGYGQDNVRFVEINAAGEMDKLNAFANELLNTKPKVLVSVSTPVTQAVFEESPASQKIIFSTVTNPSDVGMDKKPRNMTGVCDAVNYEANFGLIFELFPKTKTIGIVYNAGERNSQYGVEEIKKLAAERPVKLKIITVSRSNEVEDAAKALVDVADVIYVGSDNTVVGALPALLGVAYDRNIPIIASDSGSVEQGALAAVSVDYEALGKRVGAIVAEVLRTGKMPAQRDPVIFLGNTLILNQRSARKIGFRFPDRIISKASRIIH